MAKNNRTKRAAERAAAAVYAAHATATLDPRVAADQERRRSGAAGAHADQRTRRLGVATTNRVGSRSSQRRAAVRDASY